MQQAFQVSERCCCRATGFPGATMRYSSQAKDATALRLRIPRHRRCPSKIRVPANSRAASARGMEG